jgi:hypothetical protein
MPGTIEYSKPWLLLWVADALAIGYVSAVMARRRRGWARGMRLDDAPAVDRGHAVKTWLLEVFAQPQIRRLSTLRWAAHICIFSGFLALWALSLFLYGLRLLETSSPGGGPAAWFLRGQGHALVKIWGNGFGLVLLAGLLLALARRFVRQPAPAVDRKERDTPLLLFLLWLTLSGFLLEGLRHDLAASVLHLSAATLTSWLSALWTLHGLSGVALIAWLPHSSLMHAILAPIVIALDSRSERGRKDLPWPERAPHAATGAPKT